MQQQDAETDSQPHTASGQISFRAGIDLSLGTWACNEFETHPRSPLTCILFPANASPSERAPVFLTKPADAALLEPNHQNSLFVFSALTSNITWGKNLTSTDHRKHVATSDLFIYVPSTSFCLHKLALQTPHHMPQQDKTSDCIAYWRLVITNLCELLNTAEMTGCCTVLSLSPYLPHQSLWCFMFTGHYHRYEVSAAG